jgi:hypothetical protein
MYARTFRRAEQERRFTIIDTASGGWEVREEQDRRVVKQIRYLDWHRVERAKMNFAKQAQALTAEGWNEL